MHLEKAIAEASAPKPRSRAALMATTVGAALVLGSLGYYEVAHGLRTRRSFRSTHQFRSAR
jgi:hypothetical protein